MAVDMFLKLGDIKGESTDKSHKGEMDLLFWRWGMEQSGSRHFGGGGGAGKINVKDLFILKYTDRASPNLMAACASGKHIDKAILTVRKAGGAPLEYLVIEMEKVLVSSFEIKASEGERSPFEIIGINCAKIWATYTPQSDNGLGEGAIVFGWNIEANLIA